MKKPKILEVTLRDGSYVIDFQFTARDTAVIGKALESVGFDMIEIGHGIGLNASNVGKGKAAETDEGYMKAAAENYQHAQWGMFCIPGIARLEDIDLAAEYGMDFIRIGTNVTDMEASEPYIARAKKHGMYVCANFMKSYTMKAQQYAQKVKLSQQYGSDLLYVVDSAGGMLTEELEEYILSIREVSDIELGFHGHNNLELAVANSMRAVDLDVSLIDTSLQGMGRSGGNTPTEIFLTAMERKGIPMGFDILKVMDIGEEFIKPLNQRNGYSSIDIISGFAQFHSSYMGTIREFADQYGVDPRRLIMEVCEQDKVNAPRDLVERSAVKIREEMGESYTARFRLDRYIGGEQNGLNDGQKS